MFEMTISKLRKYIVGSKGAYTASDLSGVLLKIFLLGLVAVGIVNERINVEKDTHLNAAINMAAVMNDRIISVFAAANSKSVLEQKNDWPILKTAYAAKIAEDSSDCTSAPTQTEKRSIICNGALATLGTLLEDLSDSGVNARVDMRGDPSQANAEGERNGDYSTNSSAVVAIHSDLVEEGSTFQDIKFFVNLVPGDGEVVEGTSYMLPDSGTQNMIEANTVDDTKSDETKCYFSYIRQFNATDLAHLATMIDYKGSEYEEIEETAACSRLFPLEGAEDGGDAKTDPDGIDIVLNGATTITLTDAQTGITADTKDYRSIVRVPSVALAGKDLVFTP